MKNIVVYYFIFLAHIITLTIKLYFNELLMKVFSKDIPFDIINDYLTKKKINFKINDGSINLNSLIYLIIFFYIGLKSRKNIFFIIILSFLLLDIPIFYFEKETNIIVNILFALIGYIFGLYFNNQNYNIKISKIDTLHEDELNNDYNLLIY